MRRRLLLVPLLVCAALPATPSAQEAGPGAPPAPAPVTPAPADAPPAEPSAAPAPPLPPRGILGVGPQLGMFTGIGATVQLGTPEVGIRLAGGWAPMVLAVTERSTIGRGTTDDGPKLKAYSGGLVAPDLYVRVARTRTAAIGLQGGYRYSTLLGSGGAGGVYVQAPIGRSVDVLLAGGLMIFPDGEHRLTEKKHLVNPDFGFPGPNVNLGLSLGLLLFP